MTRHLATWQRTAAVTALMAMAVDAREWRDPDSGWMLGNTNIVTAGHQPGLDPHAWVAGTAVQSWAACLGLCAANASCTEFDYAESYNSPEINGYVESTGCGPNHYCYFRSDFWWDEVPHSGCNHTAGLKPGGPPIPAPPPTPKPPTTTPPPSPPPIPKPPLGYQPNIVFILTDDQDTRLDGNSDVYSDIGSMAAQVSVQKNFLEQGARMSNGFVATPICCPSRTETFTGRHLHNVFGGTSCMHADTSLAGGRTTGLFGVMTDLGYETGLFGKVTNDQTRILPQLVEEKSCTYIDSPIQYNNYDGLTYYHLFSNGTNHTETLDRTNPVFGTTYQTAQIGNRSLDWIRTVANKPKPFFAYLGPHAPHYPAQPAPWYVDAFPDIKIPRTPNYNISSPDKTQHIRQNPPLTELAHCWEDQHFRDRWQTLLSVDDIVDALFALLDELDIAKKTFVVYSSDHGYKQGQWRVGTSKQHPYETDIHVPLLFRGPGIPAGAVLPHMCGNIDIMPTIIDLAAGPAAIPPVVDGKSLLPVLVPAVAAQRGFEPDTWRDYFLIEYLSVGTYFNDHSSAWSPRGGPVCAGGAKMPNSPAGTVNTSECVEANTTGAGKCYFVDSTHSNSWRNLRINNQHENVAYIEYDPTYAWATTDAQGSGLQFYELYDIDQDPYQMTNLYPTAADATKRRLHGLMTQAYACAGNWTTKSNCL